MVWLSLPKGHGEWTGRETCDGKMQWPRTQEVLLDQCEDSDAAPWKRFRGNERSKRVEGWTETAGKRTVGVMARQTVCVFQYGEIYVAKSNESPSYALGIATLHISPPFT